MTKEEAFKYQIEIAKELYNRNKFEQAFYHLENAHVLGQTNTFKHSLSHYWMLKLALKRKSIKEIFGQTIRIIASIAKTWLWVPLGNTGGTNVSAIKPMPIRKELEKYFQ